MDRAEFVQGIMRAGGLTKANVNRFYDGLVQLALKKLTKEGELVLPGLGALKVRVREAREARNPQTGEKIHVPRKKVVRFIAYKDLRDALNPGLAKKAATEAEVTEDALQQPGLFDTPPEAEPPAEL